MSTIVTRADKGSPLTNTEVDANFTNLNDDKVEKSGDTLTGDLAFGDNVKAKFGASDDLQIYHDGSYSYVSDQGTGDLLLQGNNLRLVNYPWTKNYLTATNGGHINLYYDGVVKFATTSSGVDVTGTVTADGLTVDGEIILDSATGNHFLKFYRSDSTINAGNALGQILFGGSDEGDFPDAASIQASAATNWGATSSATQLDFFTTRNTTVTPVKRLTVADSGDISFYDDSGTSQDFYWDASTSRLGLGVTAPSHQLQLGGSSDDTLALFRSTTDTAQILIRDDDTLGYFGARNNFIYISPTSATGADGLVVRTDTGNVGIGNTDPASKLDVTGTITADGLTVDGNGTFSATTDVSLTLKSTSGSLSSGQVLGKINFFNSDPTSFGPNNAAVIEAIAHGSSGNAAQLNFRTNNTITEGADAARTMSLDALGDISFYEDTGTTVKLFWDASAESLGIGTTTPATTLDVTGTITADGFIGGTNVLRINSLDGARGSIQISAPHLLTREVTYGNNFYLASDGTYTQDSAVIGGGLLQITAPNADFGEFLFKSKQDPDSGGAVRDRLKIAASGDISFYEDTGTSARIVYDASTQFVINEDGADFDFRVESDTNTHALFVEGSSGNVGIGTTSPEAPLEVAYTTSAPSLEESDAGFLLSANNTLRTLFGADPSSPYAHWIQVTNSSGSATFPLALNPQGGNVGIGTTTPASPLQVNRASTDGAIVTFSKDGTTVGSIASYFGGVIIGNADTALRFNAVLNTITPRNVNGGGVDNTIDLGDSAARFKDLYLSGGVYLGGTGSANLLNDYEEGTFTATLASAGNTGATTLTSNVARYTKIGDVVHIFCTVTGDANLCDAGDHFDIGGLPFASSVYAFSRSPFNGVSHAGNDLLDNRVATGVCSVFENSTKIDVYTNVAAIGSVVGETICTLTVCYTVG